MRARSVLGIESATGDHRRGVGLRLTDGRHLGPKGFWLWQRWMYDLQLQCDPMPCYALMAKKCHLKIYSHSKLLAHH